MKGKKFYYWKKIPLRLTISIWLLQSYNTLKINLEKYLIFYFLFRIQLKFFWSNDSINCSRLFVNSWLIFVRISLDNPLWYSVHSWATLYLSFKWVILGGIWFVDAIITTILLLSTVTKSEKLVKLKKNCSDFLVNQTRLVC